MSAAALGLDIGGTKIAAGIVESGGRVLQAERIPCPSREGPEAVLVAAAGLGARLLDWAAARQIEVAHCGAGAAGVIDRQGRVTFATDAILGWQGTRLAEELERRLGLPVRAANDVHALALGESRFGAARGWRTVLCVAVGTGIGGAVVYDGEVVAGATGTAGELGHVPAVVREGRRCACGVKDHVEAYSSGPAIAQRYAELAGIDGVWGLDVVAERAEAGDRLAAAVLRDAGAILGTALGGILNLVDPEVLVLGGGVVLAGERFLAPLEEAMRAQALPGPRRVTVRPARFQEHSGVVGAAALVLPAVAPSA